MDFTFGTPVEEDDPQEEFSPSFTWGDPVEDTAEGFTFGDPIRLNTFQDPQEVDVNSDPLFKYGDEVITKEMILEDDDLFNRYVLEPFETRFGEGSSNRWLLDPTFDKTMGKEELFEVFQNYQRSFAGGQTVTTASEVAFLQNADDQTKQIIGRGYMLFDRMPNIFSEETSWGEMFEGLGDYARAAIIDPTTVIGLGVGRLWAGAGTKAGAMAIRQTALAAAKEGITKKAITKAAIMSPAMRELAGAAAVDLSAAVAADLGYQYSMMETGVQQEYSPVQTSISALGAVSIPAVIVGFRGVKALSNIKGAEKIGADAYLRINETISHQMTPQAIEEAVMRQIDGNLLADRLGQNVKKLVDNPELAGDWRADVLAGRSVSDELGGVNIEKGTKEEAVFSLIWDGTKDQDGLQKILDDAGFYPYPRYPGDNATNFYGDVIKNLPDEYINNVLKGFEGTAFADMTAEKLSTYFKRRVSLAATEMGAMGNRVRRANANNRLRSVEDVLKELKPDASPLEVGDAISEAMSLGTKTKKQQTKTILWVQSLWKRLVTSHPGTTALNVKGFGATFGLNNISDVIESGLLYGTGRKQEGWGTLTGAVRRGYNVLNWMDTLESAEDFLSINPKLAEKLHRHITAGVDIDTIQDVAKQYGLDPKKPWVSAPEKAATLMQHLSGVRLQDEVTKRLSFMSNLDQNIRKHYGMDYNDFLRQDDAFIKMMSPEFADKVALPAIDRAMRETYSYRFSDTTDGVVGIAAKFIETISNTEGLGMLIPFGQFMNNAVATISDYSGMNLVRFSAREMYKKANPGVAIREEALTPLVAKTLVGWSLVLGYFLPREMEKMEQGIRWNQEEPMFLDPDGSLRDTTFEAPYPYFSAIGRVIAHNVVDGEVPDQLATEVFDLFIGQSTRELGQAGSGATQFFMDFIQSVGTDTLGSLGRVAGAAGAQVVSGMTRPLDPINQFAALVTDNYENLDRRQGVEAWNEAMRYVDQVLPVSTSPEVRNYPTSPTQPQPITNVMGHRQANPPTTIERMLARAGMSPWKTTQWGGQYPQLKNRLDGMIEPILDQKASEALFRHPDFFEMELKNQEKILGLILEEARKEAKETLSFQLGNEDQMLYKLSTIYGYTEKSRRRALKLIGLEDMQLEDIANDLGLPTLDLLIDALQNESDYLVDF